MTRPLSDWYSELLGLGQPDAVRALFAAGIVDPREGDEHDAEWALMRALRDVEPPLLQHLPAPFHWGHRLGPRVLAAAMRDAMGRIPAPARRRAPHGRTVALPAWRAPWMQGELLDVFREAAWGEGLATDVIFHSPARGPASWAWPLAIGVLPDADDLGGVGPLVRHWWNGKLFRLAGAGYGAPRFDLLLLHGDAAVEALRESEVEATAVVRLDTGAGSGRDRLHALHEVRKLACAAFAADVDAGADRAGWLYALVGELAHGHPLHVALRMVTPTRGHVLADRTEVVALNLHASTERQLLHYERSVPADAPNARLVRRISSDLNLDAATAPHLLRRVLEERIEHLSFDQESQGATTLGGAFAALADVERRVAFEGAAREARAWRDGQVPQGQLAERLRHLRARVAEADGAATIRELASRRPYVVEVSVGPPTPDWLVGTAPFVEPAGPAETVEGWRLRVVVRDAVYLPDPVEASIVLPATGASTTARFVFWTGEAVRPFGARVTVLQGSRVLQTGVLTVDSSGADFRVDAAPERVLGPGPGWASASLVLNNDTTGTPTVTAVHDRRIGVAALPDAIFDDFSGTVSKHLALIASHPDRYDALDADGTRELFVALAQSGWKVRRALVQGAGLDEARLDGASRIQIVSTKPATFFPAEFLYGFAPPKAGATLCPGAVVALRDDKPCTGPHTSDTVCPTGFWSLSKVIERHAHVSTNNGAAGPFTLYAGGDDASAHLDPYRQVLYGAASVADNVDPNATAGVEAAARRVSGRVSRVSDWDAWEASVRQDKPSLLLLLPHHHGADKLRIGASSDLDVVHEPYVKVRDAPDAPLVLLIGCETLLTHAKFNDFVQAFLWSGAKAVVATYGTILGRHASPATVRLLESVDQGLGNGSVRLGTVLRDLKRSLLLSGQPMVLGLTSHGDADLLLER